MKTIRRTTAVVLTVIMLLIPLGLFDASAAGKWVTAWTTSMVNGAVSVAGLSLNDVVPARHTIRTELSVTTGGTKLRFQFSNQYGAASITIRECTVAKTNGNGTTAIVSGTCVPITFDGSATVTIPAGETVWSDAIDFKTTALETISISTYFRDMVYMTTVGLSNGRTFLNNQNRINGVSQAKSLSLSSPNEVKISSSTVTYHTVPFLSKIETYSSDSNAATAVFIGDSTLVNDTYYYYAQRIAAAGCTNVAVVNQAIVGNRLLSKVTGNIIGNLMGDALIDRFDRDALSLAGVKYVFVKIGLNDIAHQYSKSLGPNTPSYTTTDLINGYKKLITMCHAKGIKIYFFTKSAWNGYERAFLGQSGDLTWSQEAQDKCDVLTNWIKTNKLADGYIDCSPLADPSDTSKLCSTLTLDGAHLTTLGSIALADLIPLSYVGVTKTGKTAAQLNGVNPYAEKNKIIASMKAGTTTTKAAATTAPATTKAAAATTVPATTQAGGSAAVATTAAAEESGTTAEATTVAAAGEATTEDGGTTAEEVSSFVLPEGASKIDPNETGAATYEYSTASKDYNISDTSDNEQQGKSGGAAVFILGLFLLIVVAGAIVYKTIFRKKAPDI